MGGPYAPGQSVVISGTFTVSGIATDPTTVTLTIIDPRGTASTFTGGQVTHDGTGLYHYNLTVQTVGYWQYKWQGTGTCQAASDGNFTVSGF